MAASQIDRAFGALEFLAGNGKGVALQAVADKLAVPKSGAHRLLGDLMRLGYARQDEATGRYQLTSRLVALAFRHLGETGIVDAAQPVLDRLAEATGDLVRLSVTDGDRQVWVAKAQGARSGLIFDPQMGDSAQLSCMATGHAWLAQLSDEEALRLVTAQGFGAADAFGPKAPQTVTALLAKLKETRKRGYAVVVDSSAPGMAAIAVAVRHPIGGNILGTVSVGGPSARLSPARLKEIAPQVIEAATELGDCCAGSSFLMSSLAA